MISIAICDDDRAQLRQYGKDVAAAAAFLSPEIDLFSSGEELIGSINKSGYAPDLAILDIMLAEENGISVGKYLNGRCPGCAIIYLTAFLGYAPDVYETTHSYFLLKSQYKERLGSAIAHAVSDMRRDPRLSFKENGAVMTIRVKDILYMERNLKKTIIVQTSGYRHTTAAKPEDMLEAVTEKVFIHCHNSYWVNIDMVSGMSAERFTMIDGQEIPISRSRKDETRQAFFAHLGHRLDS